MSKRKVAIVYDWIDKWGGVERILLDLHEQFPDADFYTSYADTTKARWAKDLSLKTSFIQRLPVIRSSRLLSLFLYSLAFETFDFSSYDLVISVTSSFAKGVITKPQTKHLCYLLTPTRYFWGQSEEYMKSPFKKLIFVLTGKYLRQWDYIAAQRVDNIVSISRLVQERCKKYYQKDSAVIYPPLDVKYWHEIKKRVSSERVKIVPHNKFFLVVSRLEQYKKVEYVIDAFDSMQSKTLVIVGTGTEEGRLKSKAGGNVIFLKNLSDHELAGLYLHAEALIMPQEEDFGYVAVEAQVFGCPVISYVNSGAAETILDGKTGIFFKNYKSDTLIKLLEKFDIISYSLRQNSLKYSPKHIEQFAKTRFRAQLEGIIKTL